MKKKGADCSGSVWAICREAGFSYGNYQATATFHTLVGTDANLVKGTHYFKEVGKKLDTPQVGDVGWWNGHMAIFDPKVGMCGKKNRTVGNVWSASNSTSDRNFGAAHKSFFTDQEGYGSVTWYRFWKAA